MLEVRDLSVRYRGHFALQDVSFSLESGQLLGILGPNGAGKSTLVKAMLGLVPASSGSVWFKQQPLKRQLTQVAYVPQRSYIDWDYPATVWRVVMMGRTVKTGLFNRFSRQSREIARTALERVDVWDLRDRPIGQLSGGQQQRVFLAKALAQEAELLFFDEPFTGVDRKTEGIIFNIFKELTAEEKTLLVINHDLGDTLRYYDSLMLLNRKLTATGSRQDVLTPSNIQQAYGHDFSLLSS